MCYISSVQKKVSETVGAKEQVHALFIYTWCTYGEKIYCTATPVSLPWHLYTFAVKSTIWKKVSETAWGVSGVPGWAKRYRVSTLFHFSSAPKRSKTVGGAS